MCLPTKVMELVLRRIRDFAAQPLRNEPRKRRGSQCRPPPCSGHRGTRSPGPEMPAAVLARRRHAFTISFYWLTPAAAMLAAPDKDLHQVLAGLYAAGGGDGARPDTLLWSDFLSLSRPLRIDADVSGNLTTRE